MSTEHCIFDNILNNEYLHEDWKNTKTLPGFSAEMTETRKSGSIRRGKLMRLSPITSCCDAVKAKQNFAFTERVNSDS